MGTAENGIAAIAFTSDGTLYGVTGDGATTPETLFQISTSDASGTNILTLGNGSDGEMLAFNPADGMLYHGSGDPAIFEKINLSTLAVTNIPIASPLADDEVKAITYWASEGVFLWKNEEVVNDNFFRVTADGTATAIGRVKHFAKGLAFVLSSSGPAPPPAPFCGDGTVNPGELCDDGNNVSGDGCPANCQFTPGDLIDPADLPTGFDGNGDGTSDDQQPGLAHVFTEEAGVVTLDTAAAVCDLTIGSDPAITLETALFIISIVFAESDAACVVAGQQSLPVSLAGTGADLLLQQTLSSSTLTVYFQQSIQINAVHVFGSTPNNPDPHLYDFFYDGETGAEVFSDRIVLHFVDGARGDDDLTVNGQITFAGGPVFAASSVTPASIGGSSVEISLLNPGAGSDQIQLSETDASGTAVSTLDLESVPAGGTQSVIADEVSSSPADAALTARGREGLIQGLFLFGNGSQNLEAVDGNLTASGQLLFPAVESGNTTLFVFNPGLGTISGVEFRLTSAAGEMLTEVSRDIAGGGYVKETASELFGSSFEPGSVIVRAPAPVVALAVSDDAASLTAIAGQTTRNLDRLLVPHFFVDESGGTRISLLNDQGTPIKVDITAFDDNATDLGTVSRTLSQSELLTEDVGELLSLDPGTSGYLELDVTHAGFLAIFGSQVRAVGSATFTLNKGAAQATIPMQSEGRTETTLLRAVPLGTAGTFTGLVILNPGSQTATVTLRALDANGTETASQQIELAAGTRIVDLLNGQQFFGAGFNQTNGHLQLSSDLPVMGLTLSGDFALQFLSATVGQ